MEALLATSVIILALLNVAFLLILLAFARQLGVVLVRLGPTSARQAAAGPAVGELVEPFVLHDAGGREHRIGPTKYEANALIFISPACEACRVLLPSLGSFARQYRDLLSVHVISTSEHTSAFESGVRADLADSVTYARDRGLAERLGVSLAPYAIVLGPDGRVRSKGIVNTLDQLESLVAIETFRLDKPLIRTRAAQDAGGEK